MERFFNTAVFQKPDSYTFDPLSRFDLADTLMLIRQQRYFVLHALRETGKTSCMLALRDYLNKGVDYIAVYANLEAGQAWRNNVARVTGATCQTLARELKNIVKSNWPFHVLVSTKENGINTQLSSFLESIFQSLGKPLTEGYGDPVQRVVFELKIKRETIDVVIEKDLQKTAENMDLMGVVDEGHFITFDRSQEKTWDERIWHRTYEW